MVFASMGRKAERKHLSARRLGVNRRMSPTPIRISVVMGKSNVREDSFSPCGFQQSEDGGDLEIGKDA